MNATEQKMHDHFYALYHHTDLSIGGLHMDGASLELEYDDEGPTGLRYVEDEDGIYMVDGYEELASYWLECLAPLDNIGGWTISEAWGMYHAEHDQGRVIFLENSAALSTFFGNGVEK